MDIKKFFYVIASVLSLTSCEDMVEIAPPTDSLSVDAVYNSAEGMETALVGLYTGTIHNNVYYYQVPTLYYSWISDDMTYYRVQNYAEWIQNQYVPKTSYIGTMWTQLYKNVYQNNDFILHVQGNSLLSEEKQKEYIGQSLWFRAFDYFWLVNSWGDVPLVLTNKYAVSSTLPRENADVVWEQIISDLKTSAEYLAATIPNGRKTRVTAEASLALLARAYLYTEQWEKAAETASLLIPVSDGGSGAKFSLEDVDDVFRASSKEAIFHADMAGFSGTGTYMGYTRDGILIIPYNSYVYYPLTDDLVACMQEEPADKRNSWMGCMKTARGYDEYYVYKYKNNSTPSAASEYENFVFLRLAEQYLIRAEANAHLGNLTESAADINKIRLRAGLEELQEGLSAAELLSEIELQRRKEFFCEQGHRWFDLKRTGRIDDVLGAADWKKWSPEKALFPIPYTEMESNRNLVQNPGYEN
ncbi:MAG: RagB/SusD family nutrient uptake outer membrane protein [Prevotella sp.]|nr:RagB/SusD family nutrient uptake outer membrane protein [Prevotella sp.]